MSEPQTAPSHPAAAPTPPHAASSSRLRGLVGGLRTRRAPLHWAIVVLTFTVCAFGVLDARSPDGGALQHAIAAVRNARNGSEQYQAQLRLLANWNQVLRARNQLERAVRELDQHHADQAQVYIRQAAKTLQTVNPATVGLETSQHRTLVKAIAALEPVGATTLEAERTRVLQIVKQLDGLKQDVFPLDTPVSSQGRRAPGERTAA